MSKSDRIVTRLEPEARARLHLKASQLGLDDAAFVRMLIYRDLNDLRPAPGPGASAFELPAFEQRRDVREPAPNADEIDETDDGERAEEMEIPADADGGAPSPALEQLLGASSSLLDEMLAAGLDQRVPAPAARQPARNGYRPAHTRNLGMQPQFGPGSRTRALGVNEMVVGNNTTGDGHGNVLRDNMRHFGFAGTRSR